LQHGGVRYGRAAQNPEKFASPHGRLPRQGATSYRLFPAFWKSFERDFQAWFIEQEVMFRVTRDEVDATASSAMPAMP